MAQHRFVLQPHPPFRLDLTVWALRRRANNEIDRWDGCSYCRTMVVGQMAAEVIVTQTGPAEAPLLRVTVNADRHAPSIRMTVTHALERLLGLRVDLAEFHKFAAADPRLAPLAQRFHGFKPPRFITPFETLVNAIACQQVTLTLGILLLNRLAQQSGPCAGVAHALPDPQDFARHTPISLRSLGFSYQKSKALIELAGIVSAGELDLDRLANQNDATAIAALRTLHGIGRWSAEYVLLRGFGRTHVFPGDDVGARNNLARWLACSEPLDYEGVRRVLEPWRPYGGLVYMHLLLDKLAVDGLLP